MTEEQYGRLQYARKIKKYGHLETWEELYYFQRVLATAQQIREISQYAKRVNKGEKITLPLVEQAKRGNEHLATKADEENISS